MDPKRTDGEILPPSKSQLKREARELFRLGRDLVAMSAQQLDALPIEADLREAINHARGIRSNVARKRQMQFIAKMMRQRDLDRLREALEALGQEARHQTVRHHRVEAWRDRLIAGGNEALSTLMDERGKSDLQTLRQLLLQARRETERGKPPAAARKLFRLLLKMDAEQPLPPAPD